MHEASHIIVYVPGKNPKPEPEAHHASLWRVLKSGIAKAQPTVLRALAPERFVLAGWNHLYYGQHRDPLPDLPWIERLVNGVYDVAADRAEVGRPHVQFQRLLRSVADRFPQLLEVIADPVIQETVRETERYFDHRRDTGREIRESIKGILRPLLERGSPVLLIGHSLGSVIAWDTLWELTHEEGLAGAVDFLSLGSPLGMRFVQSRLLGGDAVGPARYPHLIRHWHNVAAKGDLIALDPTLADDYAPMLRAGLVHCIEDHHRGVHTHYRDERGLNPHRAYGYLHCPVVATRIAEWLWRHG